MRRGRPAQGSAGSCRVLPIRERGHWVIPGHLRLSEALATLTWLAAHHRPHGVSSLGAEVLPCVGQRPTCQHCLRSVRH